MRAQPDAIADCGSDGVADCCPYAVALSEPNIGAYCRPDAVANSWPHTEVRQCHNDGVASFESCAASGGCWEGGGAELLSHL